MNHSFECALTDGQLALHALASILNQAVHFMSLACDLCNFCVCLSGGWPVAFGSSISLFCEGSHFLNVALNLQSSKVKTLTFVLLNTILCFFLYGIAFATLVKLLFDFSLY